MVPAARATSSMGSMLPSGPWPHSVTSLPTPACRHRRQVDRQHVHRHAADGAGAHAVDQHRRAGAGMARVAVGIAAGHDADAHGLVGATKLLP
jgi:hypothetical protein